MKKKVRKLPLSQRLIAFLLAFVMVVGYIPTATSADTTVAPGTITTVSDPETLTRPETIYGNSTLNAGKVTVGKSVDADTTTIAYGAGKTQNFTPADDNFIVTISQSAQVMGLSTEMSVPIDAVFVLDTSGSMNENGVDRASALVTAANSAIATLMAANENNRVAVVGFSSGGYGDGNSGNAAASQLSPLAHYTGQAATNHLQWVNSNGGTTGTNRNYIAGRTANGNRGNYRDGHDGGTNIQAGIATGAKILTAANPTLTYEDGTTITRMPVLVIISDGQPTFTCTSGTWYNPTIPTQRNSENGPGNSSYEGNGFLTALIAAYYKGAITEHYYGANASENNRCSVYTVGVDIEGLDDYKNNGNQTVSYRDDNQALAETTLDPVSAIAGTAGSTYYLHGNSWNADSKSTDNGFKAYWDKYVAGSQFTIRTNSGQNYTLSTNSITNSKNYVMGRNSAGAAMYTGGLGYNDAYYSASSGDLNSVFTSLVTEISKKALSSPTRVTVGGDHNFDGYVTFTDPIGEYMEVKDVKGILADGNFYQGASFAQKLVSGSDSEFNTLLRKVLSTRMSLTDAQTTDARINAFLNAAVASPNQANYVNNSNFDNSIVWWGNEYNTGEEDSAVQFLGFADNDTIDYIESSRAGGTIPQDADYVCRSYFFYGAAGGTAANPNNEYMYFMIRVQRSIAAPYQQTVVISAPASLLSVDEVFITESTNSNGNKEYAADVNDVYPARVIYEVGLRSDINAQNVASIVSADYANEVVNGEGSVNYDPTTDTYHFFTNDWDRSKSQESHERAMTKATFDAASDNAFYTYQQDTLLLKSDGTPYTGSIPEGQTLYYAREVYTWNTARPNSDGTYPASKDANPTLIPVTIPDSIPAGSTAIKQVNGRWYISKGVYAGSTLQVTGDDTIKSANNTGTSSIVAHPHRTGVSSNSHYTVLLGNNGKLSLVAEPSKTVSVGETYIENNDGEPVMVGETLTYRIKVTNPDEEKATTATITDSIPAGTSFVEGSAAIIRGEDTQSLSIAPENGVLTWSNISLAKGESVYATFQVVVTEVALSGAQGVETIENTATVKIGNNPAYNTNTTENPPEGKKVVSSDGDDFKQEELPLKVGDILVYRVRAHNDAVDSNGVPTKAAVTITDTIPTGTTYVAGSASHNGVYDADTRTITWTFEGEDRIDPDTSVVVSFRVAVDASAKVTTTTETLEEGVQPTTGTIDLKNKATIFVGDNDPLVTRETNETDTPAGVGDMKIGKTFDSDYGDKFDSKLFSLTLTESTGKLNGKYQVETSRSDSSGIGTIEFMNGTGNITIRNGETITIKGIPLGSVITVSETLSATEDAGWSVSEYTPNPAVITISKTTGTGTDSDIAIENKYTQKPVEFQLKGTKTISGDNFPDGTFNFHATLTNENGEVITGTDARQVTATATVSNAENGAVVNFAFSPRTFGSEQTLYYLIDEVPSTLPGVTSAANQYLLKLEITDVDSQLVATTSYKTRANAQAAWSDEWTSLDWKTEALNFTNSYTPADATFTIGGTKELNGRSLAANEFSFQLIYGQNAIATANNAAGGAFSFPAITITADDMGGAASKTFTYYVREVAGSLANVEYDRTYYKVDVTVTDENGQLTAGTPVITKYNYTIDAEGNVTYDAENPVSAESVVYTNKYNTQDVQIHLSGNKNLTGDAADGLKTEQFTFQVIETNATFETKGNIVATAGNAADSEAPFEGAITFSPINYTRAMMKDGENEVSEKLFYYIVKEVIPASSEPSYDVNMKYDTTEYHVTVKVTLNDGVLNAEIVSVDNANLDANTTSYGNLNFTNIKNPATASVTPVGAKTTTSAGDVPAGLSFSFTVRNATDGSEAGVGVSTATTEDGSNENLAITFTPLVYDHEDVGNTYYYWIYESNNTENLNNGVDYSDARYLMKVVVSRDANNKIIATETYYNAGTINDGGDAASYAVEDNKVTAPSYENEYNASGHINLTALKEVNGKAPNNLSFDFKLVREGVDGSEIAGVSHPTTGVITFGTLNYAYATEFPDGSADTKDITYTLTEIEPNTAKIPGVTYDKSVYKVVITLTHDNDGNINAAVTSVVQIRDVHGEPLDTPIEMTFTGNDLGVTFENPYKVATGTSATITATKTLDGRPLANDEFAFELYRWTGSEEVLVETATNKDGGVITFTRNYPATISSDYFVDTDNDGFKDTATFVYHMDEIDTQMGGINYSGDDYWVKVVIEHDQDVASLKLVSMEYYTDYDKTTGEFSGAIEASQAVFDNTYTTNDTSFTPVAKKVLHGRDLVAGEFSFQIVETDDAGNPIETDTENHVYKVVSTGNNNADGSVTFAPIGYTDDGTYHYVIRELAGTDPTITYNPEGIEYYLKVTVVDDGEGVLSVGEATYYADKFTTPVGAEDVIFENHYGPGYVTLDLGMKKDVQEMDQDGNPISTQYVLKDGEFDFNVYKYDNGAQGDLVTSGTNDANGNITFGSIVITRNDVYAPNSISIAKASKTFKYVVVEEVPSDAEVKGITTAHPIVVDITVEDDGYGNLTQTAISYSTTEGSSANGTFVNIYEPKPTELTLTGSKVLVNKHLTEGEFHFQLKDSTGAVVGEAVTNTAGTEDNPYLGNVTFPKLTFNQPGTFTYTVNEVKGTDTKYSYDETVYTVVINVTDDVEGNLHAVPTYYSNYNAAAETNTPVGGIIFTNTYTPGPITEDLDLAINADKQIKDNDGNVITGEGMLAGFAFVITDIHGVEVTTGTSDANGDIDFGSFTFDKAGEYHYYINEVVDVKPGYTEDANKWALHILVSYNEATGKLEIKSENVTTHLVAPEGNEGAEEQAEVNPVFVNIYNPDPAKLMLTAKKELTGRDLHAGEFIFHLVKKDAEGKYTIMAGSATNDEYGNVKFYLDYNMSDMLDADGKYESSRTFVYQIHEHEPESAAGGITYDTATKHEFTVEVKDVGGQLKAYINGNEAAVYATGAAFKNTYTVDPVEVTLKAEKTLSGAELAAGAFDFELVDSEGKVIQTVKNAADGSITFEKLTFTQEMMEETVSKEYVYSIREKAGTVEGMTYDETVYTVTITITDDQKGRMTADVVYSNSADAEIPEFHNEFVPVEPEITPAMAVISAQKTLTGRTLTASEFTFELVDAAGKVTSAANDTQGNISFTMTYNAAGTYEYVLREKTGAANGVTYDTSSYKVTVTVTQAQDGVLSAVVTYGTTDGKAPIFKNTYAPVPVSVVLEGKKVLNGRDMKAGEFKFEVKDASGTRVATGTNDAKGNIVFDAIELTAAGKYELTVTEVNSRAWFMTYDKTKFTVTIDVQEEDGVLEAEVTYPTNGIKFVNTYKPKPTVTPSTGDNTPIYLLGGMMALSAAAIVALLFLIRKPKKRGKYAR